MMQKRCNSAYASGDKRKIDEFIKKVGG